MNNYKVGDRVRAMVWREGRATAVEVTATISEVCDCDYILTIDNPPTGMHTFWYVYLKESDAETRASGYVIGPLRPVSVSPFMHDPYGVGPEGTTGGPSGLLFL